MPTKLSSFPAAAVLTSIVAACFLLACEPKVPSPRNPATTVPASVAIQEAESLARAKESEASAALRRFKLNAKKLESEHEISLADLQADLDEYVEKTQAEAVSLRETTATAVKAAEDLAAAEAEKRAEQERLAARIIDGIDILKLKAPEVAAAFKNNSKDLAEWLGPEATALVNRIQHS